MKNKIMIWSLVFMLSAFAGSALGGSEGATNTFYGLNAGNGTMTGTWNTFLGRWAGYHNTTGDGNAFLGYAAGYQNTTGDYNAFLGSWAGYNNTDGHSNTFLGQEAGWFNITGSNNTFLGKSAGFSETGSNKLYIDNCYSGGAFCTDPFIYGEFDNRILKVDGSLGVGTTPVRQLHVAGSNAVFRMDRSADTAAFMLVRTDVSGNPLKTFVVGTNASGANTGEFVINDLGTAVGGVGNRRMTITNAGNVTFTGIVTAATYFTSSSLALKTNVRTYENPLETVKRLRGVRFDWKDSGTPAVGLIAEEVEGVVPEVVAHGGSSGAATGVNYSSLVAVLVEAVKEQQTELNSLQEAISQLKDEINRLKSRDLIAQR